MGFDSVGRSVSAVKNGETILDIEIGFGGSNDVLNEMIVVGFFAGVKTKVFKKDDFGGRRGI